MKLYEKIMYLRKQNGMSQEDLAFKLDVSRQSVYKWETGTSVPEMDKIRKLSEIFGVTYDALLNDAVDVTVKPVNETRVPAYRDTFDSGERLGYEHADFDHGYYYEPKSKKRYVGPNKTSDSTFARLYGEHADALRAHDYTKTVQLQHDILASFFTDDRRGVIGFFWDGAEQFVCPYENIIDFSITNDGQSMGYEKSHTVGVMVGSIAGVGVGSQPVPDLVPATRYELSISYFTKDGTTNTYKLRLGCVRLYTIGTAKKKPALVQKQMTRVISAGTAKSLEEIRLEISGARAKAGKTPRVPVDTAACAEEVGRGKEQYKKNVEIVSELQRKAKKKRLIKNCIFWGFVAAFLIFIVVLAAVYGDWSNFEV